MLAIEQRFEFLRGDATIRRSDRERMWMGRGRAERWMMRDRTKDLMNEDWNWEVKSMMQ